MRHRQKGRVLQVAVVIGDISREDSIFNGGAIIGNVTGRGGYAKAADVVAIAAHVGHAMHVGIYIDAQIYLAQPFTADIFDTVIEQDKILSIRI